MAAARGDEEEPLQDADKGLVDGLGISIVSLSCPASRTEGCAPSPVLSGEESNNSDHPRVLSGEVDEASNRSDHSGGFCGPSEDTARK